MLGKRIKSGLLIGALLLSAIWFLPVFSLVMPLIVGGLAVLCTREVYNLMQSVGWRIHRRTGMAAAAAWVAVVWFAYGIVEPQRAAALEMLSLALILAVVFGAELLNSESDAGAGAVWGTIAGLVYVTLLLNFITKSLLLWEHVDGRLPVLFMIVVVKCSDMAAFFVGSRWGRRKLFPRVSPAKTWEGFAGGLAAALVVGVVWWLITGGRIGPAAFRMPETVILCLLFAIVGVFGDLSESLAKRVAGHKDSGACIGGMGGILDVIDSLLFAAPLLYAYLVFLVL